MKGLSGYRPIYGRREGGSSMLMEKREPLLEGKRGPLFKEKGEPLLEREKEGCY